MNRLRHYRKALGMTQEDLAEKSGVSLKKIREYESEYLDININASGEILYRLSRALGCTADELIQKYVVVSTRGNDEKIKLVSACKGEAILKAREYWENLSFESKMDTYVQVRAYLYDNENEGWGYDVVNWATWYAVIRDDDENDWGNGSYDLNEAILMAAKHGNGAYIAEIYRDTCVGVIKEW